MTCSMLLDALARHRWNVPVVAEMNGTGRQRFTTLVRRLDVSRDSLSRSLRCLGDAGLVLSKNEPHSHYRLSKPGRRVAPSCIEILAAADSLDSREVALRRWTLPILTSLENWSLRFAELRAMLPAITPRALTLALKEMIAAGLVEREVIGGFPPSALYRLTTPGTLFLSPLARIK